jgi:hypothetical protein
MLDDFPRANHANATLRGYFREADDLPSTYVDSPLPPRARAPEASRHSLPSFVS